MILSLEDRFGALVGRELAEIKGGRVLSMGHSDAPAAAQ